MPIQNCGELHIRTSSTDSILYPNTVTQSIVSNGMRLGIIPERSDVGEFLYNIVVKNSSDIIIFQNSAPISYSVYGTYIYVIIPFASLPNVGEIINIRLSSTDGCTTSTDYIVLSYSTTTDNSASILVNGVIEKYIKLKPSISYGGYFKDNFYYFKCNSNTDSDDECFIQFKQNTDTSKVLTSLPTNTSVVDCPDSSDWSYIDTLCVSNTYSTTSPTTTTLIPCATGLTLDNIVFDSGTQYRISYTSTDVYSITWKLFDSSNVQIKTGNSGTLTNPTFFADFGTLVDGTYTVSIKSDNCSSNPTDGVKSFTKGTPTTTTLTPCATGLVLDDVANISGSQYKISYTSTDVYSITWKLYNSQNILLKTGNSGTLTNPTFFADFGTLVDGTYTVSIKSDNCSSNPTDGVKSFTKGLTTTSTTTSVTTIPTNNPDGFKLTVPNKPQYYFSNNHAPSYYDNVNNLPAIHTSETHVGSVPSGKLLSGLTMPARYDINNDIVWLENNYIKIGINLKRGGHIAWASLSGSNTNMVYNGFDGGFQIGLDAYERPDGYTLEGQTAGVDEIGNLTGNPTSYNVTHGGDYKNNSVSLIDYHPVPNGYYIKLRPIQYAMRGMLSESYIEATYTLTTNAVKCDYVYTSFRTDSQRVGGTVGWAIPACFLLNSLNKYITYNGASPFTNDSATTIGNVSDVSTGGTCGSLTANTSTENWLMCYNPTTNLGIGVYNATHLVDRSRMEVKQCYVYPPDRTSTEFDGGFTYMSPTYTFNIPANQPFTKSATAYIIVGSPTQVREKAYQINNPQVISTPSASKVYYAGGKHIYNGNGTINYTPINPVLTNDYTFTETVCRPCRSGSGYRLMYSFEEGHELAGDYDGWKYQTQGLSIDLSKMAGKTILYRSACVGYAYNQIEDIHSTYIYLKPNSVNRSINGLTYVNYANNFVPDFSRNLPSVFYDKIPKFTLPNKHNIYEGTMPTDAVNVNLNDYGIKAWHLKRNAKILFQSSKNYITDPDTIFADVQNWNKLDNTYPQNLINTFSTQEMINRANQYSSYGALNTLILDDEHRQGRYYDGNGLTNMLTFFTKVKQNLPNTILSAHHNFPIKWNKNDENDDRDRNLFNNYYSNERAIYNDRQNGLLGQYWTQNGAVNIGNSLFGTISLDAYIHFYTNPSEPYKWAMLCKIHKKWYPNHIITPTIEGWLELLGNDFGGNSKEKVSWKISETRAERKGDFPLMSISQFEQVAMIGNLLGDGVNFWGDFLTRQDNRPNLYYAIDSLTGLPEGYTDEDGCNTYGVYQASPTHGIDYWFLALQKLSQIPSGYDWNTVINYDISLDGGTTWVTGENLIYGFAFRRKHPMVFGIKNAQNKFVICAIHPFNNPIDTFTFKVRTTGMNPIDITVDGQFPQLIINNN